MRIIFAFLSVMTFSITASAKDEKSGLLAEGVRFLQMIETKAKIAKDSFEKVDTRDACLAVRMDDAYGFGSAAQWYQLKAAESRSSKPLPIDVPSEEASLHCRFMIIQEFCAPIYGWNNDDQKALARPGGCLDKLDLKIPSSTEAAALHARMLGMEAKRLKQILVQKQK